MANLKIHFSPSIQSESPEAIENAIHAETSETGTCTDAEPFALRVLDKSMEPEFRSGCIIIIDPTGHAREGSFVLARLQPDASEDQPETDGFVFRQLTKRGQHWLLKPLNDNYPEEPLKDGFQAIIGVIVQRAGTRRRYHKRY